MPRSLASKLADTLADGGWRAKARPEQLLPDGDDWNGVAYISGRGWGKTRTGSEGTKELVEACKAKRIALVAPTAADARDIMVEGESGILAVSSDWCRPIYEPSKRKLTWPNGAIAHTFSSEEADRLRGPQFDFAWADELAAWNQPQATWDMLSFGLRLGSHPRWIVTTTPRPIKLLKDLLAREGKDVVVTARLDLRQRSQPCTAVPGSDQGAIRGYTAWSPRVERGAARGRAGRVVDPRHDRAGAVYWQSTGSEACGRCHRSFGHSRRKR